MGAANEGLHEGLREIDIQQGVLLALGSRSDCKVWRNNVGTGRDPSGRVIRFGVPGSADVFGILAPSGRFLALEIKSAKGRLRPEQAGWGEMVRRQGGIYEVVRSIEEAVAVVERAQEQVQGRVN
jgi:hypothetical protein